MGKFFEKNANELLILSLSLIIFSFLMLFINLQSLRSIQKSLDHANSLLLTTNQALNYMQNSEADLRDYIISPNEAKFNSFNQNAKNLNTSEAILAELTLDSTQTNLVAQLRDGTAERVAILTQGIYIRNSQGFDAAKNYLDSKIGTSKSQELRSYIYQIQNDENNNLQTQEKSLLGIYQLVFGLFLFTSSITSLFIFLNFFIFNNRSNKQKNLEFNKDNIVYSISHDFSLKHQTILNLIESVLPTLRFSDNKTTQIVTELRQKSEDLLRDSEVFKDIFMLETGMQKIGKERVDITQILKENFDTSSNSSYFILADSALLAKAFASISNYKSNDSKVILKKSGKNVQIEVGNIDSSRLEKIIKHENISETADLASAKLFYALQIIKNNMGKVRLEKESLSIEFPLDLYNISKQ